MPQTIKNIQIFIFGLRIPNGLILQKYYRIFVKQPCFIFVKSFKHKTKNWFLDNVEELYKTVCVMQRIRKKKTSVLYFNKSPNFLKS